MNNLRRNSFGRTCHEWFEQVGFSFKREHSSNFSALLEELIQMAELKARTEVTGSFVLYPAVSKESKSKKKKTTVSAETCKVNKGILLAFAGRQQGGKHVKLSRQSFLEELLTKLQKHWDAPRHNRKFHFPSPGLAGCCATLLFGHTSLCCMRQG